MKKKRKTDLIDRTAPYKVVAAGFNVMRFKDEESARDAFRKYQGPGSCLLIHYSDRGTKFLEYKRVN